MVDIALDPNMYYLNMSAPETIHKAAQLGYEYVELSPRRDFHFWHHYPKADDRYIAELNQAVKDTGVKIRTLNPVFNWSAVDEQERQAQVRNWKRLLEIADQLDVRTITSEFSGDPNTPRQCEHQWYKSMFELVPTFERYGIELNMEAHPYDFVELNDPAVEIVRGMNLDWVNYEYCCPHTFHLSDGAGDVERMLRYAGPKLKAVHVADVYNHKINDGNRYIINPPGVDARVHQHNEIGDGEVPWDELFATLRDMKFDGVLTVCMFGWIEKADEANVRMRERLEKEFSA
ncbi:sugar phosphate isomerase/epimerase family protein [Gleimia hominis]|uniref:sugar phosphate isomerase/epimerase family protein n=1 Tax=Gleimia hominis TaxID=595468 RepID=UPI000C808EDA|nr:sugar phosphate isomerase/epimerase [Gleimia hominis]WIK65430.1 sugar phosphate isomerase/epimerase [Gleimia hominis]